MLKWGENVKIRQFRLKMCKVIRKQKKHCWFGISSNFKIDQFIMSIFIWHLYVYYLFYWFLSLFSFKIHLPISPRRSIVPKFLMMWFTNSALFLFIIFLGSSSFIFKSNRLFIWWSVTGLYLSNNCRTNTERIIA